jgi:hypothetical protein
MSFTMASASLPVFVHYLSILSGLLDKAEIHATARKIDPEALLGARLYSDMHSFRGQVQFSCDFAKGAVARLAGIENPSYPDNEIGFEDLRARITKTLDFIASVDGKLIEGGEDRAIALKFGGLSLSASGRDYLVGFAVPSFIFHVSIAYALLRHNGIEIRKLDFLGKVPGMAGFDADPEG